MPEAGQLEWAVFAVLVAGLLVVDAFASRGSDRHSRRKAWTWSGVWIGVALAFGLWIGLRLGSEAGLTYFTAYALEKSLSVDNLVLFALVFSQTGIPPALQHRALFWGILGTLVMRGLLIGFGIYLFERFHWLVYPFGVLLLYAAVRMLHQEQKQRLWVETNCVLCTSWIARFIPITPQLHGNRFTVRVDGKRYATPMLVALAAIELADLVFAVDSIPAVFAITRDPFLVYTSNIFALLGLRSLYAVIGDLVSRFRYLHFGLAALLAFVAAKLLLSAFLHIPTGVSLGIVLAIFAVSVLASRLVPPPRRNEAPPAPCAHEGEIKVVDPATSVCAKCQASGDDWVHLRMCMACGNVGCCDSSKNRHATAHFNATGHPIIRSIEPGENWKWCYVDQTATPWPPGKAAKAR
jgi:tellurite resistance protein TerC